MSPHWKGKVSLTLLLWVENQPLVSTFGTRTRNLPPAATKKSKTLWIRSQYFDFARFFSGLNFWDTHSQSSGGCHQKIKNFMNLQSIFWYRAIFFCINLWDTNLQSAAGIGSKLLWNYYQYFGPLWFQKLLPVFFLIKLHCEVIVCPFDKGFESFIYALQVEFYMQQIRHSLNFQDESHVYQLLNTAHFKLNIFVISRDQPKKNWLYVVYLIIWLLL